MSSRAAEGGASLTALLNTEIARATEVLGDGGVVVYPILILALLLWFFIALRFFALGRGLPRAPRKRRLVIEACRRGDARPGGVLGRALESALEALVRAGGDRKLEVLAAVLPERHATARYRSVIRSIVIVAPLLGLLGTVSGMIETFRSLGEMALFRASGGVAGGIAEALLTTQLGLMVAIPGHIVGKFLERRESQIRADLDFLVVELSHPGEPLS